MHSGLPGACGSMYALYNLFYLSLANTKLKNVIVTKQFISLNENVAIAIKMRGDFNEKGTTFIRWGGFIVVRCARQLH